MSTSVTFNGTSYTVPAIADASWGTNVSNYLIAIASGCLQKTGGSFTLSQADVDFGATYGLKAVYFKSKTANIASAGVVQLARADVISWRNNANGADLSLGVTSGDVLTFNSIPIVSLALGSAYTVLQMNSGATAYTWATPTGTGAPVLANTPTLITPVLGVATATSINKMAITAPATSSTLAVADGKTATISNTLTFAGTDGKTVTFSNSLTFAGTDGNTMTFPSGSSTVMTLASADTITGIKTFGDGKLVLSGSSSGGMTVKAPAAASTFVATFFAATDTVVGLTFQQTMTNKLFSDSTVKFANVSDATKLLLFSLGGATTAKTMTFISSHTNDRSITFPDATDTLMGKATTDTMTNKTATAMAVTGGSYIDFLVQAACRFNDDSGGEYVAIKAPTGVTTHTLLLPAAQGAASTTLTNDGSGNLSWAAAASATLNQYNVDIGNASNVRTATNTNLLGDISGTTVSQSYTVTSAAPGVFTVAAAPATGSKAYVTVTQNGFTANTTYYVTNVSGTTFKLATTLANAIAGTNITSSGTTAGTIISGGLSLTSGVIGTVTNDSATAGYVGQEIISTVARATTGLTSATAFDITNISLTPGDWEVSAQLNISTGDAVTTTKVVGWVSSTSATLPSNTTWQNIPFFKIDGWNIANDDLSFALSPARISLSAATTYYFSCAVTWTTGAQGAWGRLHARRVR